MSDHRTEIREAAKQVVENTDDRLRLFFDDDGEEEQGPIFQELKISEKYEKFCEVASGGMKTIYSVYDRHADRTIAMAQLHKDSPYEQIEPFLREARLTARLDHPNIIKIHDIGLDGVEQPYFTMDLKTGENLCQILKEENRSLSDLLVIYLKVCDAVSYAHSRGVIHLDLKPSNIQIGAYGEVVVCDWGLGKIIDDEVFSDEEISSSDLLNDKTLHGKIKGTPGYMAPEQITDKVGDKNNTTDCYSLGVILYKILCGKNAFAGNLESVLMTTLGGDFKPPSRHCKVPERLESVCLKAMSTKQEDRYQTVEDLQKDIVAWRDGYLTSAEDFTFYKALMLLIKRNKMISATILCAVIFISLSTVLFISRVNEAKNEAIESKIVAEGSEKKALELAEKYRLEKEESERRGKTSSPKFHNQAIVSWRNNKIGKVEELINEAIDLDPENRAAVELKARFLSSVYRYKDAIKFIENNFYKNDRLNKKTALSRLYNFALQYQNSSTKTDDQKIEIIREAFKVFGHGNFSDDYVYSLMSTDFELDKQLKLCRQLLKIFNPQVNKINFHFNEETGHLNISGNPKLTWINCLNNFPVNSIDMSFIGIKHTNGIRNTPALEVDASHSAIQRFSLDYGSKLKKLNLSYSNVNNIESLPRALQKLDISHTPVKELNILERFGLMCELTIHEGQFKIAQLALFPEKIKVLIK